MDDTNLSPVDCQEVAMGVAGGVGVQEGTSLVYVSPTFASIWGTKTDALTGAHWRTLAGSDATEQTIRDGLTAARTEGHWEGTLRFDGRADAQMVDATLSMLPGDSDMILWILSARDTKSGPAIQRDVENPHPDPSHVSPTLAWTVLDSIDDVVYVINEDGEFTYWNDKLVETTGYSHDEIRSMHPAEFIPQDQQEYVPGLMEAVEDIRDRRVEVDILTKDGDRITHEFSGTTFEEPGRGRTYRCGIARNLTERLERERKLERQRDELMTLNRINDLLFETARELIRTGSRSAVEEAVCDRLVSSELYNFVWIGERDLDGEGFVSRESAGFDADFDTALFEGWGGLDTDVVAEATRTGAVKVADSENPTAAERGATNDAPAISSLAAVPLQHGETVYGVLVVTTDREDAFNPRERAGFEVFGQLMGVVIHAARSRELLFADTVIQLEFDFTESDSLFAEAARTLDCRLTLDGYVPSQSGWVMYLTVDGASPAAVVEEFSGTDQVARARRISGEENTGRIEVGVTGVSVLQVVSDAGATVQQASATPDTARFVIEAPIETDVRRFVDSVGDAFPAATLFATRKRDREITTVGRPGGMLDELTDRQREVLEAAYQAGYFAWPRESTAEEVSESLGLASATLHGHLRKAEHVILSGLLDSS